MKTRHRSGPSAQACTSTGQVPCLDAHQGAVSSSGHFQLRAFCASQALQAAATLVLSTCSLCRGSPHCHLMDTAPLSLFLQLPQPSNAAGGHSPAQNLPSLPQDMPSSTAGANCIIPFQARLNIPPAASTKRDNCPLFQAWRTWGAALAAEPCNFLRHQVMHQLYTPSHKLDGDPPPQIVYEAEVCLTWVQTRSEMLF